MILKSGDFTRVSIRGLFKCNELILAWQEAKGRIRGAAFASHLFPQSPLLLPRIAFQSEKFVLIYERWRAAYGETDALLRPSSYFALFSPQ